MLQSDQQRRQIGPVEGDKCLDGPGTGAVEQQHPSCLAGALVWLGGLLCSLGWLILRLLAVAGTAAVLLAGLFLLWVYGFAPAIAGLRRDPA